MDSIDEQILAILTENSRLTNKEIGAKIHLTGQAVGARILKLQEKGIIDHFSVKLKHTQMQFIRVFMDSNRYAAFEQAVNTYSAVSAIYKVSGQACYVIIAHFSQAQLTAFIEEVSKWGRYSVEAVVADKTQTTGNL
jgi:Lrp/AsnC family leucine-responsive transcriptional regulator